jgi:hypothetical protein
MTKYKFKTNVPEPSDESIGKHKDFKRLRANYTDATKRLRKPLYKNPKVFLALILIVLLAYLLTELLDERKKKEATPGKKEYTAPKDTLLIP